MKVVCKSCEAETQLKRNPDDKDMVLLEALTGWTFTTDTGWLCKECSDPQK